MKTHNSGNKRKRMDDRTKGFIGVFISSLVLAVLIIMAKFHLGFFKNVEPKVAVQTQVNTNAVPKAKPAAKSFYRALAEQQQIQVPGNQVAPETAAALARFGLSATNLVKISVVAQTRPPVVLPNPLSKQSQ